MISTNFSLRYQGHKLKSLCQFCIYMTNQISEIAHSKYLPFAFTYRCCQNHIPNASLHKFHSFGQFQCELNQPQRGAEFYCFCGFESTRKIVRDTTTSPVTESEHYYGAQMITNQRRLHTKRLSADFYRRCHKRPWAAAAHYA